MNTKARLTKVIDQCCDILRTDDGLNNSTLYTEALSWILYLKFFSDRENERKSQAELIGEDYHSVIKKEFQWSVWTDPKKGKVGKDLINWINGELIPYLAGLKGSKEGDPRDIIAAIFRNVQNRVNSGFLLRDVIEKIQTIHFDVGEESFCLSLIYEDLLRKMGEGGGKAGEYYTPRPLVKALIQIIDPKIGETIYDPACGTCGFLVQSHLYLEPKAKTPEARKILNSKTFFGKEKTPLPYILGLTFPLSSGHEQSRTRGNYYGQEARSEIR